MERLTNRDNKDRAYFDDDGSLIRGANGTFHQKKDMTAQFIHQRFVALDKTIDRLAAYEDTGLTPEEVKQFVEDVELRFLNWVEKRYGISGARFLDMVNAEQDGRLVVLPCNTDGGVTLRHSDGYDYQADHWNIFLTVCRDADTPVGYKSHLFSIEEAEAALEARKGERHETDSV